jgi:hypothetical protein
MIAAAACPEREPGAALWRNAMEIDRLTEGDKLSHGAEVQETGTVRRTLKRHFEQADRECSAAVCRDYSRSITELQYISNLLVSAVRPRLP